MKYRTKYPIYVLSKGRYENCLTVKFLIRDNVKHYLVVEHQEYHEYKKRYRQSDILVLPPENTGKGAIPVRNFIWEHSIKLGAKRHWCLDDNMRNTHIRYKHKRIKSHSYINFLGVEHFTDRYENIGLSGMSYSMMCADDQKFSPFFLNCHVYSCILIDNSLPIRWRGPMNADTDLCLQVFALGLCTVNFNVFLVDKEQTMKNKGGNTDKYKNIDGRLKMARCLERRWPKVVRVVRKFGRPQHSIIGNYRYFDTPLVRKNQQIEPFDFPYELVKLCPIRSGIVRDIYKSFKEGEDGAKN